MPAKPACGFGSRLDYWLARQGLTRQDVARRAGVSARRLENLAGGGESPSLETVQRIADAMGVAAASLVGPAMGRPGRPATAKLGTFGRNLEARMRASGMTRRDLCEAAGITYATLWGYLRGRTFPGLEAGLAIAKALEIEPEELLRMRDALQTKVAR